MVRAAYDALETQGHEDPEKIRQAKKMIKKFQDLIPEAMSGFTDMMEDQCPDSMVQTFQDGTGISAQVLNNIRPPDVVKQIWAKVKATMPDASIGLEAYFKIDGIPLGGDRTRKPTTCERVNAIYHQLNFLGYQRDRGMKKQRGFTASFGDMTHAGVASFCHYLLTGDRRLARKAFAAYEYLGLGTQVKYIMPDDKM